MIAEIVQQAASLNAEELDALLANLTDRQRLFVHEYAVDANKERAAKAAGYSSAGSYARGNAGRVMDYPEVREAATALLARREQLTELKAEYIREYILSILELCPTDHFMPAMGGGWQVDEATFQNLPHEVKRLIECVELRQIRGERFFAIKFVSKNAALALAARFTLVQKIDATVTEVPWKEVVKLAGKKDIDTIEQKLLEYGANGLAGTTEPVHTQELPLA